MRKANLRSAKKHDCEVIWKWRNDKTTRKYSFNTEFIPFEKHKRWFENVLKDENRKILMVEEDGNTFGVVRLDINPKNQIAEININIAPQERGKGLGLLGIKNTCRYVFESLNIKEIVAKIKKENIASTKMFFRAGFDVVVEENNVITMRLISKR